MKKRLTAGFAVAMAMVMMSACGGKTEAPAPAQTKAESQAAQAEAGKEEKAEKEIMGSFCIYNASFPGCTGGGTGRRYMAAG